MSGTGRVYLFIQPFRFRETNANRLFSNLVGCASSSKKLKPLFFHFGLHCGSVYLGKRKENDVPLLSRQHDTVRTCHLTARMSHLPAILDCNRTGLLGCQRNDQRTSALKHNRIRAYPTVAFAGTLASCFQLVLADSQCWSTTSFKVNAAIT